ncbi:MAG: helix-turn-helix transcriptional regulator [Clostridia bacterium]|nr:helix-turn-helix transcriptional regulator [Synergistaceae bacterium]MBQ9510741.1 helix-turn-helix transcriptional regulator [Clostridia bacterium]
MLSENLKIIRKSKGLSQEELAVKLNVVRQTVSKWEQGLSVPDADLLISISEALETPVSILLGENITEQRADDLKAISEKLEVINLQLSQRKQAKRKTLHWFFITVCLITLIIACCLTALKSPYLNWNFNDPEIAVAGTAFHAFEFIFFRVAPFAVVCTTVGAVLTRNKQ